MKSVTVAALRYPELSPVRAEMVAEVQDYRWSRARAHLTAKDEVGRLDMKWWRRERDSDSNRLLKTP
jgi:hypothetical protein